MQGLKRVLAAYLEIDGVDKCQVGFTSLHIVKHGDKFDGALGQIWRYEV